MGAVAHDSPSLRQLATYMKMHQEQPVAGTAAVADKNSIVSSRSREAEEGLLRTAQQEQHKQHK